MTSLASPAKRTAPVLAIVGDPSRTRMEQAIGSEERVAMGLRAFRTVKLTSEDAARDALLAPSAATGPRAVIFGLDGEVVAMLPLERVTAAAVWDAMRTAVRSGFGVELDTLVERQLEVERDLERLESDRKAMVLSAFGDTSWESENVRITQRRVDLEAKQREIWALTPRGERQGT